MAEREEEEEGGRRVLRRVDRRETRVVVARGRSEAASSRNSSSGSEVERCWRVATSYCAVRGELLERRGESFWIAHLGSFLDFSQRAREVLELSYTLGSFDPSVVRIWAGL